MRPHPQKITRLRRPLLPKSYLGVGPHGQSKLTGPVRLWALSAGGGGGVGLATACREQIVKTTTKRRGGTRNAKRQVPHFLRLQKSSPHRAAGPPAHTNTDTVHAILTHAAASLLPAPDTLVRSLGVQDHTRKPKLGCEDCFGDRQSVQQVYHPSPWNGNTADTSTSGCTQHHTAVRAR